jgi:hypothetical protein
LQSLRGYHRKVNATFRNRCGLPRVVHIVHVGRRAMPAKSKSPQKAAGAALAAKRGEQKVSDL